MAQDSYVDNPNDPISSFLLGSVPPPKWWVCSSGNSLDLAIKRNPHLHADLLKVVQAGFEVYALLLMNRAYGASVSTFCQNFFAGSDPSPLPQWYRDLIPQKMAMLSLSRCPEKDDDILAAIACFLGRGELLLQKEPASKFPPFRNQCSAEELWIIFEVKRLGDLFEKTFFSVYPSAKSIVFNPTVDWMGPGSGVNNSVLLDGSLIDFKIGSRFSLGILSKYEAQLWGNFLFEAFKADKEKRPIAINRSLDLYLARCGAFLSLDITKIGLDYINVCAARLHELMD